MVLIKEDHTKCGLWSLGRVVEVHSEEDGVVWVVTVQTSKSTYKRPALKISQQENDGISIRKWWEVRGSSRWEEC